jgi:hypothetical protein
MRWRHRHTQGWPAAAGKQVRTLNPRSLSSMFVLFLVSFVVAIPESARAQSSVKAVAQLPAKWNDAVETLAGKIANLAGRAKTISLEVENISSLNLADVTPIRQSLEMELTQRGFRLAPESRGQTHVIVTLSEGVEGYIWVAQIGSGPDGQTAMVSVSKDNVIPENPETGALFLEKKLVWQQPLKFLDFALVAAPDGSPSTLVILEPDRFAYYRSSDATYWAFFQAIPVFHSSVWTRELRDLRGFIDNESGIANLPGIVCAQSVDPSEARCAPEGQKPVFPWRKIHVPGHEDSETMTLLDACGEDTIVLSTGDGDWTQPDRIQGYLAGRLDEEVRPSGAPIPVEGPVISLARDAKGSGARAVVHNLKTGNYEGYVITANCGR